MKNYLKDTRMITQTFDGNYLLVADGDYMLKIFNISNLLNI